MRIAGIIPARYGSTRFPGKPLAMIHGVSMIERVYQQAVQAQYLTEVVVATDDARIFDHVKGFGGMVVMTLPDHASGTERCHEAASKLAFQPDAVVNIQGDEPYIKPAQIDEVCALIARDEVQIATLVKRIEDVDALLNPNKVKAVLDAQNKALYFSRSPIPFLRDLPVTAWLGKHDFYKHIGLYAYKTDVLRELVHFESSALERAESLEQLRWIERGRSIYCGITRYESPSVDAPEDITALDGYKAL
jgi:3-deoxy-manno-octulosonate cytidylyltransferase (CMP-KDO synthetase)